MDLKELSTRTVKIMGYCVVMMGYYSYCCIVEYERTVKADYKMKRHIQSFSLSPDNF